MKSSKARLLCTLCCVFTFVGCEGQDDVVGDPVQRPQGAFGKADVYGDDSRLEINDPRVSSAHVELGRSVAAVINTSAILSVGEQSITLNRRSFANKFASTNPAPLCETERFREQPAPAQCTAFLIAPDLVATAGHCINTHTRCFKMAFVFDFVDGDELNTVVPLDNYYRCEQLVATVYDPREDVDAYSNGEYWSDWAIIKLDRPVDGRTPLPLASGSSIGQGDQVFAIGHPSGTPLKYASGLVVDDDRELYVNTTLDIYSGNSGSPVFDDVSNEVIGIAVRGSGGRSFGLTEGDCFASNHCTTVEGRCSGNHVFRASHLARFWANELRWVQAYQVQPYEFGPQWQQRFDFEQTGTVDFVTVHLNGQVADPTKLQLRLRHGDTEHVIADGPHAFQPSGRWTRTSFEFDEEPVAGDWQIEVVHTDGESFVIEWAQIIIGVKN